MVLDILSFVKELTRDIYVAHHFQKENRQTCLKIYDKLREIQSFVIFSKPVSDDCVCESILPSIERDMQSVREAFEESKVAVSRTILTGAYESQKLDFMLSTCTLCQQRLEAVLSTIARNHQEFSSLVSSVKEFEVDMSETVHDLVDVPTELYQSLSVVRDAVKSIAILITPDRSLSVLSPSSTAADRSGLLLESSIDVKEKKSVKSFSQLPSAVYVLMLELARKRLLPAYVTKYLECIVKMWEVWRVDINDVEYDEMSGKKPHTMGKRANSVVCAAKYKMFRQGSGELLVPVAVKEIEVDDFSDEGGKRDLVREFCLRLSLRSPYIIRTYSIWWPGDVFLKHGTSDETQNPHGTGKEDRKVRIVMERMACSLRHALRKKTLQTSEDKNRVLRDMCKALLYLHDRDVVHRNVKPENVLSMDRNGIVGVAKLTDLGCPRHSRDRRLANTMSTVLPAQGTTIYTPSEVIENPGRCHTRKSWDVWSYGPTICDVFSARQSGKLSTLGDMNDWNKGILIEYLEDVADSIEDVVLKALAVRCLSANENDRPQISEIEEDLDKCDLESAVIYVVDENESLSKRYEGWKEGLKKRDMQERDQLLIQYEIPTGLKAEDMAYNQRKDGQCVINAQSPEDSEEPDAKINLEVGDESETGVKRDELKAVQLSREAAKKDDSDAKFNLGRCYENGTGVQRDDTKAVQLYREAAEEGYLGAKNSLGVCYQNGTGVERDESKAVQLYREAADEGHLGAKINLGLCYNNGIGVIRDELKAVQLYSEAADGGSTRAKYNLGLCYQNGTGVERDESKAVQLYREAADGGYTRAKYYLGLCYEDGIGVERDELKVVQLYREAAEEGDSSSKFGLGACYVNGTGVESDVSKAVQLFREAAEEGCLDAKCILGYCYKNGIGVERDELKAVLLYREAAEEGDSSSKFGLGVCYEDGTGVERDESKAVLLYREAADEGHLSAKYNLGLCYQNGTGVERDEWKAVQLYREAAEEGDSSSKFGLGVCYEDGIGVERDESKAVQLYREAADEGHLSAKYNLGECFRYGIGVERDESKAVQLYREAADEGHLGAKCNLGLCYEDGIGVERDEWKAVQLYREAAAEGSTRAMYRLLPGRY